MDNISDNLNENTVLTKTKYENKNKKSSEITLINAKQCKAANYGNLFLTEYHCNTFFDALQSILHDLSVHKKLNCVTVKL
jgi:hypothetical protein